MLRVLGVWWRCKPKAFSFADSSCCMWRWEGEVMLSQILYFFGKEEVDFKIFPTRLFLLANFMVSLLSLNLKTYLVPK
jgi:hypothetical protein